MKSQNLTFEDKEFRELERARENSEAKNWEDFYLELAREKNFEDKK